MFEERGPQMQTAESDTPWAALIGGIAVVVLLVVATIFYAKRQERIEQATQQASNGPALQHLYSEDLAITEPKMSQAENLVGGKVTYLDGKIQNLGAKTLTGITVECIFRDSMGQMVQKERVQMLSHREGMPYIDTVDFKAMPLKPNEVRNFRLTFDRISAEWAQGIPEIRIVNVTFAE